jgi:hypothetical protein
LQERECTLFSHMLSRLLHALPASEKIVKFFRQKRVQAKASVDWNMKEGISWKKQFFI